MYIYSRITNHTWLSPATTFLAFLFTLALITTTLFTPSTITVASGESTTTTTYLPPCPTVVVTLSEGGTITNSEEDPSIGIPSTIPLQITPTVSQSSITKGELILTFTTVPCGDLRDNRTGGALLPNFITQSDVRYYGSKENALKNLQCSDALDTHQRSQTFTTASFNQGSSLEQFAILISKKVETIVNGSGVNTTTVYEEFRENGGTVKSPFSFHAVSQQALLFMSETQLAEEIGAFSTPTPTPVTTDTSQVNSSTSALTVEQIAEAALLSSLDEASSIQGMSFLLSSQKYSQGDITVHSRGTSSASPTSSKSDSFETDDLEPQVYDRAVPREPLGFTREVNTAAIYCESYFILRRNTVYINGVVFVSSATDLAEKRNIIQCYLPKSPKYQISEPEGMYILTKQNQVSSMGVFTEQCYIRNYGIVAGTTLETDNNHVGSSTAAVRQDDNTEVKKRVFSVMTTKSLSSQVYSSTTIPRNLTVLTDAQITALAQRITVKTVLLLESPTCIINPAQSITLETRALQVVSAVTAGTSAVGAILSNQAGLPLQLQLLAVIMSNAKCSSPTDRKIADVGLSYFLSPFLIVKSILESTNVLSQAGIETGTGSGVLYDEKFYLTLAPVGVVTLISLLQLLFVFCCRGIQGRRIYNTVREEELDNRSNRVKHAYHISEILQRNAQRTGASENPEVVVPNTTPSQPEVEARRKDAMDPHFFHETLPVFVVKSMRKLWWLLSTANPSQAIHAYIEEKDVDGVVLHRQITKNPSYVVQNTILGAFGHVGGDMVIAEDINQSTRQKIERARFLYRTMKEEEQATKESIQPRKNGRVRGAVLVNIEGGNNGIPKGLTQQDYNLLASYSRRRQKDMRPPPDTLVEESDSDHSDYYFDEAPEADGPEYHFIDHEPRKNPTLGGQHQQPSSSSKYNDNKNLKDQQQDVNATLAEKTRQICDKELRNTAANEKVTLTEVDEEGVQHTRYETATVTKSTSHACIPLLTACSLVRFPSIPAFLALWLFTGIFKSAVELVVFALTTTSDATSSVESVTASLIDSKSASTPGEHLTSTASTVWYNSARSLAQYTSVLSPQYGSVTSTATSTSFTTDAATTDALPASFYYLTGMFFVLVVLFTTPLLIRFRNTQGYYQVHWELLAVPLHKRWVFPEGVWLPTQFRRAYGGLFGGYNHNTLYWHVYGYFISILTVVMLSAIPISVSCEFRYFVMFGVYMLSACWILVKNPYRSVGATVLTAVVEGQLAMFSLAQVGALMMPSEEMEGFKRFVLVFTLLVVFIRSVLGIWSYVAVEISYIRQWKAAEEAVVGELRGIIRYVSITELDSATRRISKLISNTLGIKSIYTYIEKIARWETERELEVVKILQEDKQKIKKQQQRQQLSPRVGGVADGEGLNSPREDPGVWEGHGPALDLDNLDREELQRILQSAYAQQNKQKGSSSGGTAVAGFKAFEGGADGPEDESGSANQTGTKKWSNFQGWNPHSRRPVRPNDRENTGDDNGGGNALAGSLNEDDFGESTRNENRDLEEAGNADSFIITAMADIANKQRAESAKGARSKTTPKIGPVVGMPVETSTSIFDFAMVDGDSDDSSDDDRKRAVAKKGTQYRKRSVFANFFSGKKNDSDDDDDLLISSGSLSDDDVLLPGQRPRENFDEKKDLVNAAKEGLSALLPQIIFGAATPASSTNKPSSHRRATIIAEDEDFDEDDVSSVSTPPLTSSSKSSMDTFESVPSTCSSTPSSVKERRLKRQKSKKALKQEQKALTKRNRARNAASAAAGSAKAGKPEAVARSPSISRSSSFSWSSASSRGSGKANRTKSQNTVAPDAASPNATDKSDISVRSFNNDGSEPLPGTNIGQTAADVADDDDKQPTLPRFRKSSLGSSMSSSGSIRSSPPSPTLPKSPTIPHPTTPTNPHYNSNSATLSPLIALTSRSGNEVTTSVPDLVLPESTFGRTPSYMERQQQQTPSRKDPTTNTPTATPTSATVATAPKQHSTAFTDTPTTDQALSTSFNGFTPKNVAVDYNAGTPGSPLGILRRGTKSKSNRNLRFSILGNPSDEYPTTNISPPYLSSPIATNNDGTPLQRLGSLLSSSDLVPEVNSILSPSHYQQQPSSNAAAANSSTDINPMDNSSFILIRSNNMFGGNVTVDSTRAPRSRSFRKLLAETVEDENATFHNSFHAGSFVEEPRVEEKDKTQTMPRTPSGANIIHNSTATDTTPVASSTSPTPAAVEDREQQRSAHFDVEGESTGNKEVDMVGRSSIRSSSGLGSLFAEFRMEDMDA